MKDTQNFNDDLALAKMTLGWPENFIKMTEMAEMVYVIKDTIDIYCFCKSWHETAQEDLLFKLLPVFLKEIEKFLHLSLKTVENFADSKSRLPRQWERANPQGSPGVMLRLGIDRYIIILWK